MAPGLRGAGRASAFVLALSLTALPGCSGDDGVDPAPAWRPAFDGVRDRVRRLEPSVAPEAAERPGITTWRVPVPAGLAGWRVDRADLARVQPPVDLSVPDVERVLRVEAAAAKPRVVVPVPQGVGPFGRVVVTVSCKRVQRISAALVGEGFTVPARLVAAARRGTSRVTFDFDVPSGRRPSVVALRIERAPCSTDVYGLELAHVPPAARLPDPGEAPRPVSVPLPGSAVGVVESRPAVGLAVDRPVVTRVVVPETTGRAQRRRLRVAAGVPDLVRVPGTEASVRVTVAEGRRVVASATLLLGPDGDRGWTEGLLPLDGLAGREVRARFELVPLTGRQNVVALAVPQLEAVDDELPTVLLVTSDTHRADHLGCAPRAAAVATPVLDALAARGVLFTDCLAGANVTNPSHASILTGLPVRDVGVHDNQTALSEEARTLAEAFRDAGWATLASVGAQHVAPPASGLGQGFDRVLHRERGTRDASEAVATFVEALDGHEGVPLFAWLHLFDAHTPYEPPEPFDRLNYPPGRDPFDPSLPEPRARDDVFPESLRGARDVDFVRALYRGEVSFLDDALRALFARPRVAAGVVAFTSDHGESLGEGGVWWQHAGLAPQNLRVPLVLAWPGGPRGERAATPVSQLELGRTLLDLAGLSDERTFPGRSLLATGARPEPPGEERARFALAVGAGAASVSLGSWHLVLHLDSVPTGRVRPPLRTRRHELELWSLEGEPEQVLDLAPHRARVLDLKRRLVDWLGSARRLGRDGARTADGDALGELAALGYVEREAVPPSQLVWDPECACEPCRAYPLAPGE